MTVYSYFQEWRQSGVYERIIDAFRVQVRDLEGKNAVPTAAIIDSQSVKTSEKGGSVGTMAVKRSRAASGM